MVQAWYIEEAEVAIQPAGNNAKPPKHVSIDQLLDLGVIYYTIPFEKVEETLKNMAEERGYGYRDEIHMNREKLPDYEAKMREVAKEHWHPDEEIRYVVEGKGYLDVRDKNDQWIRLLIEAGDLFILPPHLYHRFTVTDKKMGEHG
ncbi:1,2-dihydroxy-3-keto-5-methylthiopentene dioxygenase 3 [Aphelenchoides avenae]|nr:1,2-dihydroxy-3-keto-5-methylthiopentene dioxygenase 3 [Aphelenchus avenae]